MQTTREGRQREGSVRARQLWEEAIAAKGGRDRLYAVRSFVVSSISKYHHAPRGIPGDHTESLFVLPDKWWEWVDHRPGSFGLWIFTFDFGKPVGWDVGSDAPRARKMTTSRDVPRADDPYQIYDPSAGVQFLNNKKKFAERQILYLMETRNIRPTPVNVRTASLGSTKLDVVEARVDDEKVEFYLDQHTHLAARVAFTTKTEYGDYVEAIRLDDYREVAGIQMPHKVRWGDDEENRTSYQINVDYDESIFERPPTIDMGPEAWKKR
jgi:hypothetical protein